MKKLKGFLTFAGIIFISVGINLTINASIAINVTYNSFIVVEQEDFAKKAYLFDVKLSAWQEAKRSADEALDTYGNADANFINAQSAMKDAEVKMENAKCEKDLAEIKLDNAGKSALYNAFFTMENRKSIGWDTAVPLIQDENVLVFTPAMRVLLTGTSLFIAGLAIMILLIVGKKFFIVEVTKEETVK